MRARVSRTDRLGKQLPRLSLTWTAQDQTRLERVRSLAAKSLLGAGIGRLLYSEGKPPDLSAHHHAGTTRLGRAPDEGVVDADGRVFGHDNLFVTGASLFPSAGFANPTLTIVAMAIRLAENLAGRSR